MARGLFPLYPHPPLPRQATEALLVSLSFQHSVPVRLLTWSVLTYSPYLWHLVAYKMLSAITFVNTYQAFSLHYKIKAPVFVLTCTNEDEIRPLAAIST